jgi:pilus assembly protein Flp/PilA
MTCLLILTKLLRNESGQDLVEYALVLAMIALGTVASMRPIASAMSTGFSILASDISSAGA